MVIYFQKYNGVLKDLKINSTCQYMPDRISLRIFCLMITEYCISSYSFLENYSFLHLEIVSNSDSCRNIWIFYLINWIFAVCENYSREETIQGRKLYEKIRYLYLLKIINNFKAPKNKNTSNIPTTLYCSDFFTH